MREASRRHARCDEKGVTLRGCSYSSLCMICAHQFFSDSLRRFAKSGLEEKALHSVLICCSADCITAAGARDPFFLEKLRLVLVVLFT